VRASTFLVSLGILVLVAPPGCGSDAKKSQPTAAKTDASGKDDAKSTAKAEKAEPSAEDDDELHFDITKDRSGVLARAASTLETTDRLASNAPLREHVAELSHHAERGPSDEVLCKQITLLKGDGSAADVCARTIEHQRVKLGPEVFAQMAACITQSKTAADIARCEEAELEAERLLHENKHGDGLDEATCEKLFVHFEKLAMADAGEHETLVEEVLEEVRADIIEACLDHGTNDEVQCAMKASDMETLGKCESSLL
jgi:hypothetical protein